MPETASLMRRGFSETISYIKLSKLAVKSEFSWSSILSRFSFLDIFLLLMINEIQKTILKNKNVLEQRSSLEKFGSATLKQSNTNKMRKQNNFEG